MSFLILPSGGNPASSSFATTNPFISYPRSKEAFHRKSSKALKRAFSPLKL